MSTNFTPSLTDPPFVTPTWTLVDELPERDADDDEWEEDEVMYVTLDFGRHMKPEGYHHVREVQLINVNAATPYARLGGQIFRGQHEELIGSEILLQHKDVRPTAESSKSAYRPFATTSSRIVFHPISIGNVSITKGSTRARTGKPKAVPKPKAAPKKKEPVYDEDGQLVVEKKKVGRPKGSKNKAPEDGEPKKERKKRGPNKTKVPTVVPGTSRSPANMLVVNGTQGGTQAGPSRLGRARQEEAEEEEEGSEGGGDEGGSQTGAEASPRPDQEGWEDMQIG